VTLLLGAANRDPERFPEPDALRLDRTANPHVGFGRGIHFCLGSTLAAAQARTVFGALARHFPTARVIGAPRYRPNLTLRGLERLHVVLR
jgi:cytochrome P450